MSRSSQKHEWQWKERRGQVEHHQRCSDMENCEDITVPYWKSSYGAYWPCQRLWGDERWWLMVLCVHQGLVLGSLLCKMKKMRGLVQWMHTDRWGSLADFVNLLIKEKSSVLRGVKNEGVLRNEEKILWKCRSFHFSVVGCLSNSHIREELWKMMVVWEEISLKLWVPLLSLNCTLPYSMSDSQGGGQEDFLGLENKGRNWMKWKEEIYACWFKWYRGKGVRVWLGC